MHRVNSSLIESPISRISRSHTLNSLIDTPHYTLVSKLAGECASSNEAFVSDALDALAYQDPTRAALVLTDVSIQSIQSTNCISRNSSPLKCVQSSLLKSRSKDILVEHLERLPTFDAMKCRFEVAGIGGYRMLGLSVGALALLTNKGGLPSYLSWMKKFLSREDLNHENLARFIETSRQQFAPLSDKPQLSQANHRIMDEYQHTIARALFRPERYGYGHVCDVLQLAAGHKMAARVQGLWGNSLDEPSLLFHQCADSAPTTRSFFVSRGIPADVYVVTIGGIAHNITVAFFSENGRFVPVVADASPYAGFYSIKNHCGRSDIQFINPLGITNIYSQRADALPIVSGDFRFQADVSGLLPWFCEELSCAPGRIIGFAGVSAWQKVGYAERGTPEYYGNGERSRHLAIEIAVLPHVGSSLSQPADSPFIQVNLIHKGNQTTIEDSNTTLHPQLAAHIVEIAKKHFPDVERTIRRLGIDFDQ